MGLKIAVLIIVGFIRLKLALADVNEQQWVPFYHVAPQQGWMNDPNGLSYFNGYYHVFYQHNPDEAKWGPMHWGHARSTNMLNWEYLPIALAPSLPEDIDGVFSGSAVINNGNLTLIYTGVSGNYAHQMQCLATSPDGLTFIKEGAVLKRDGDDKDFRDPKAWFQDDSWFVLVGTKISINGSDRGEVLLYKSPDLHNWEYQGVFAQANEKQGYMWECPDMFTLGDKQILVVNPQGIEQDGFNYQNLYQTGYFVGNWSPGTEYQIEKDFREIDHGHDFYASQTFLAPDGRRILIGWMDMWESVFPESAMGWAGMLTLPRELTLSPSGDLEVRPITEVIYKRSKMSTTKNTTYILSSKSTLFEEQVSNNEINLEIDLTETTTQYFGLRIGDAGNSDAGVKVIINSTESRLFVERYYPEYGIELSSRSIPIDISGNLTLDVFVDRSSIEVFVNDGQAVLSSRIYPNDGERDFTIFMEGGRLVINRYEYWYL